jgi:hypothetical protein
VSSRFYSTSISSCASSYARLAVSHEPKPSAHYGSSYLLKAVQMFQQKEKAEGSPRDELKQYLKSGAEAATDVVTWWGVSHSCQSVCQITDNIQCQCDSKYPTLKRIARDYLLIQGSATPSEHAFSSGGITGCLRRNSLLPEIFEGLQILKSAYWNGHLSAVSQAAQSFEVLIQSLDDALDDLSSDTEVEL